MRVEMGKVDGSADGGLEKDRLTEGSWWKAEQIELTECRGTGSRKQETDRQHKDTEHRQTSRNRQSGPQRDDCVLASCRN